MLLHILIGALVSSAMSTSVPIVSRHAGVISDEIEAVKGLLQRVLPEHQHLFDFQILSDCNEVYAACFEVQLDGNRITVRGSSGAPIFVARQLILAT